MAKTRIKLIVGEKYQLYNGESAKEQKSFEGVYYKQNPVLTTNEWARLFEPIHPEGHLFLVRGKDGKPEVYCSFKKTKTLNLMWYSDGDDGPEWPAGFRVSKVTKPITNKEHAYLEGKLREFEVRVE